MESKRFEIETHTLFSKSLIWQLNRDYFNAQGVDAWRKGVVPHQLTSNSMVGKTYAELIFAFLKDLADKGQVLEKVYILELGAGHGRLAFHILKHLERLKEQENVVVPPCCYILSDIVEENLKFFYSHPQFQVYYKKGILDVAYFDAIEGKEILLRHSGLKILPKDLKQPLLAIANYFFDSIPSDLFYFKDKKISNCFVTLETSEDPKEMDAELLLKKIDFNFQTAPAAYPIYQDTILNEILEDYRELVFDTYLFFPHKGLQCLQNLKQLSQQGLMVISMDKGFHEIHDLENTKIPEMITHGSMSFWVNYHAFGTYCKKLGGTSLLPSSSNFHLELACLMLLPDSESFTKTKIAYERFVNDFGPDDFNGLKRFTYKHLAKMELLEIINMLRLSSYDSSLFVNVLPQLKQVSQHISFNERTRLAQTMHKTWDMYFTLYEYEDLAFEIGGMFYALGFYEEALDYFQFSINLYGHTPDEYYNRILCYYQLRKDALFLKTLEAAITSFPDYKKFDYLKNLDLTAV
jgi:tetratricopeptide (TPR) repeat protein